MKPPFLPPPLRPLACGLGIAALGLAGASHGQNLGPAGDEGAEKSLPALKLLARGSVLQTVLIPSYDEANVLKSSLRARKLTLVDEDAIDAEEVAIRFYHPDGSPKATLALLTARLHELTTIRSSERTTLEAEEIQAEGTGLVYHIADREGFLFGPATARTIIQPQTSMSPTPPLRSALAGAALMVSAAAAPPERLTSDDLQAINQLTKSSAGEMKERERAAKPEIERNLQLSREMDRQVSAFLTDNQISSQLVQAPKPPADEPENFEPVPPPPEEEGPPETSTLQIDSEDGIYFDAEKGLLVFLKNVVGEHPDFSLTGADELKVQFDVEEPADEESADEEPDADPVAEARPPELGDPSKIIATGAVRLDFHPQEPGKRTAKASARQVLYDFKTKILTLRGGEPWVISEELTGRNVSPDGYILFNTETGDIQAVGEMKTLLKDADADASGAFTPANRREPGSRTIDRELATTIERP